MKEIKTASYIKLVKEAGIGDVWKDEDELAFENKQLELEKTNRGLGVHTRRPPGKVRQDAYHNAPLSRQEKNRRRNLVREERNSTGIGWDEAVNSVKNRELGAFSSSKHQKKLALLDTPETEILEDTQIGGQEAELIERALFLGYIPKKEDLTRDEFTQVVIDLYEREADDFFNEAEKGTLIREMASRSPQVNAGPEEEPMEL